MAELSKALVIGDSISMAYTPVVADAMKDRLRVVHHEGNGCDTVNVLANLDAWLATDGDAGLIHFNAGLHDLKLPHDGGDHQVPLERYRENLRQIVERLTATHKPLIWATITPVNDARHRAVKGFDRRQEDVEAYNAAAIEIVTAAGIAVNDLHAVVQAAGADDCLCEDGVHMADEGTALLASAVARALDLQMRGAK